MLDLDLSGTIHVTDASKGIAIGPVHPWFASAAVLQGNDLLTSTPDLTA
jgi:hypothetical protein